MKDKTQEEVSDAVLAFCERYRLDRGYQCPIDRGILHRKKDGRYRLRIGSCDIHLDGDLDDWVSAYRLLGLDKADAVNELNKWESRAWKLLRIAKEYKEEAFARFIRNSKLESDLKAERARNAALVAALERIKQVNKEPEMDVFRAGTKMMLIAENALEANKKGGVQG